MSAVALRSRILSSLRSPARRLFSSNIASPGQSNLASHPNHSKESLAAAEKLVADQPTPPPPPPPSSASLAASNRSTSNAWSFFKYSLIITLTGAAATVGYVSYAYSLDEVEKKTKDLRAAPQRFKTADDASTLEKFKNLIYHSALTVPAKATEIYLDARTAIEEQIKGYTEPYADKLLPDLHPAERGVFTLVLDLQETILYSYWTREKGWQTIKRPGVDAFLEHLSQFFEIVVYSDQAELYIGSVMERLDSKNLIRYKLGKAATKYVNGKHYRDLSKLNRDPAKIIYLSAHAREDSLQPENAAQIKPFKLELDDTALLDFIPFLEFVARNNPADIRQVLASYEGCDIPEEFIRRSKDHQRRMQEQKRGFFRRQ